MKGNWTDEQFLHELQRALRHMYDPAELRRSRLVEMFGLSPQADIPTILRRMLIDSIQILKPLAKASPDSTPWRIYQVLSYRHIEQSSQKEVATDLTLSIRQLRRLEYTALRALADTLIAQYLDLRNPQTMPGSQDKEIAPATIDDQMNVEVPTGREEELEWLRKSSPSESVELIGLVNTAIKTIGPLLSVLKVQVETSFQENLPSVMGKVTLLRQALLNVLTTAARKVPGGKVQVSADAKSGRILIDVVAKDGEMDASQNNSVESLSLAKQLVELSSGTLEIVPQITGEALSIRLSFPMMNQVPVLVIDDNEDALRLFKHYLSGTIYQFIGTSDPQMALILAEEYRPAIVLLDVMLPMIDGWELLGRLRAHPLLNDIRIIISTILPQQQLALALGAAEFIRKPFSQETLLEALNRQMGGPEIELR